MPWYLILLIVVAGIAVVGIFVKKLTGPRFNKNAHKYLVKKEEKNEEVHTNTEVKPDSAIGLNLEGIFSTDEEIYFEGNKQNEEERIKPRPMNKAKIDTGKTLLEQIKDLSPELKALLFDRGLARKEYDFNSKQDWTSILFTEVWMFNFFNEIKSCVGEINKKYNIVNMSGKLVYIEGHKGLSLLSKTMICLKIKKGNIKVEGRDLILQELFEECVKISGKIEKIEVFDAEN